MIVEIWIPRNGAQWITQNSTNRWHWRTLNAVKNDWKANTTVGVMNNLLARHAYPASLVTAEFFFHRNRRRDPSNFYATTKPIIDHLVKHFKFWPDDGPEWVEEGTPILTVDKYRAEGIMLRIQTKGTTPCPTQETSSTKRTTPPTMT